MSSTTFVQYIRTIITAVILAVLSVVSYQLLHIPENAEAKPLASIFAQETAPSCTAMKLAAPGQVDLSNRKAGFYHEMNPTAYYTVNGNSTRQIVEQMLSCAPQYEQGSIAVTLSQASIAYDLTEKDNGICRVINPRIGIKTTVALPEWKNSNTNETLEKKWNTFAKNIAFHENGHVSIDAQYGQKMYTAISTTADENCTTINQTVKTKLMGLKKAMDAANAQYDKETEHGHTQGVILQ